MNTIKDQLNLAQKAIQEMKNQNKIFENLIQSTLEKSPESDKKDIQDFQVKINNILSLAKSGKIDEAQELLKNINYGR